MDPLMYRDQRRILAFRNALPRLLNQLGKSHWVAYDSHYGVAGNTFRGISGFGNPPGLLYWNWAYRQSTKVTAENLRGVLGSREEFEAWHASLVSSLKDHWARHEYRGLRVAHRYKLVDLYIKWLSRHDFGDAGVTQGLVNYAHFALDRQTLNVLNKCLSGALPLGDGASMGRIKTRATYNFCQELVSVVAAYSGGTSLLFDYYAWRPGAV